MSKGSGAGLGKGLVHVGENLDSVSHPIAMVVDLKRVDTAGASRGLDQERDVTLWRRSGLLNECVAERDRGNVHLGAGVVVKQAGKETIVASRWLMEGGLGVGHGGRVHELYNVKVQSGAKMQRIGVLLALLRRRLVVVRRLLWLVLVLVMLLRCLIRNLAHALGASLGAQAFVVESHVEIRHLGHLGRGASAGRVPGGKGLVLLQGARSAGLSRGHLVVNTVETLGGTAGAPRCALVTAALAPDTGVAALLSRAERRCGINLGHVDGVQIAKGVHGERRRDWDGGLLGSQVVDSAVRGPREHGESDLSLVIGAERRRKSLQRAD